MKSQKTRRFVSTSLRPYDLFNFQNEEAFLFITNKLYEADAESRELAQTLWSRARLNTGTGEIRVILPGSDVPPPAHMSERSHATVTRVYRTDAEMAEWNRGLA